MKKLNQFLFNAPLWQIFILSFICLSLFTLSQFSIVFYFSNVSSKNIAVIIKICTLPSVIIGIIIGAAVTNIILIKRESTIFWTYAKELELIIKNANTKDTVMSVFENEYQELHKKRNSLDKNQALELNKFYTILQTKYKYMQ